MLVRTTLRERGEITEEEIETLKRAENMPITYDEENPELTEKELKEFYRVDYRI